MDQQRFSRQSKVLISCCALVLTVIFSGSSGCAAAPSGKGDAVREQTPYELRAKTHAVIKGTVVSSPLGRFLLIRKGNEACAVRFTAFHSDYDAKPATRFQSGQENVYAEYDWFYQSDGSFDMTKTSVTSGHGKLHEGPSVGLGRMAFKFGMKSWIECGSFTLLWSYPTKLGFDTFVDDLFKLDRIVELVPTKWEKIEEVDFMNPKLHWVRYSEDRTETWIPLESLP